MSGHRRGGLLLATALTATVLLALGLVALTLGLSDSPRPRAAPEPMPRVVSTADQLPGPRSGWPDSTASSWEPTAADGSMP